MTGFKLLGWVKTANVNEAFRSGAACGTDMVNMNNFEQICEVYNDVVGWYCVDLASVRW